jgi:phage-related protein
LAGFGKAAALNAAATAAEAVIERTSEGVQEARDLEVAYAELARELEVIGQQDQAAQVLDDVSARARELGFDEVEAVTALNTILNKSGDVEEAVIGLEAAFDLTRANDELTDLASGAELVRDVFAGDVTASVDDFGATMDELADPIDNITNGFQNVEGAAEAFAGTTEGLSATLDQTIGAAFVELGKAINEVAQVVLPYLIDVVIPALVKGWEAIQPALQAVLDLFGALYDLLMVLEPLWGPLVDIVGTNLVRSFERLATVLEVITAAIEKVTEGIEGISEAMEAAVSSIRAAAEKIKDAILGPLSGVTSFLDSIGGRINNLLGRSADVGAEYDAANDLYSDRSGGRTGNVYMNVVGDPALIEQSVERALGSIQGRRLRNRLGAQYG